MPLKLKAFLNLFRYIDLFQQNISLKIKSKYRVSLVIGRFLSLGIIIFILYNAINSDMINKANPIVLQQSIKTISRPAINLDEDNFFFAFGISDDFTYYPPDPTLFTFKINQVRQSNGNLFKEDIDFEYCNQTTSKYLDQLYDLGLSNLICLRKPNFTINGYWNEDEMIYFDIDLKICVNNSEQAICKSKEEINEFFTIKYFNIFLIQQNVDINNYEKPILTSLQTFYTGIEIGRRKEWNNYFKKTSILTDSQVAFEKYDEQEAYIFEEGNIDFIKSDEDLLSFNIYSSDYIFVYSRRYEKLFSLLANLGGILNPLLLIGSIIIKYFNNWKINELIMNKIYTLGNDVIQNNKKKIFKVKINSISNPCLKFSAWEKIKYFFKRKKNFSAKEVIYHNFLKKSDEKLDLYHVLKKLEEIQRLKLVLFNARQLEIFEYFSKNIIFNKTESKKNLIKFTYDNRTRSEKKHKKIIENLRRMKQDKNPSTIDINLLKMIDGVQDIRQNLFL